MDRSTFDGQEPVGAASQASWSVRHGAARGCRVRLSSLIAIIWLGCETEVDESSAFATAVTSAPLLEATMRNAVALMDAPGGVYCSGSIVSPLIALTAAHCVFAEGVVNVPFAVYAGPDASIGGQYTRALTAVAHPDYEPFGGSFDLAVVRLAAQIDMSAGIPLAEGLPEVGADVTFVGFGSSDAGPLAFRHTGTAEVQQVEDGRFSYAPGTCPGDSGGPVLEEGDDGDRIMGVVSTGDLLCSHGTATSVAASSEWIAGAVRDLDPEACRGGDDLCGSECPLGDPDCPCVEDDRCALCHGADPDCSFACGPDGACADPCIAPDPDCYAGTDGVECSDDTDCMSALCWDGQCRQRCRVDPRAGCPPWLECVEIDEGASACLPPPAQSGTGCSAVGRGRRHLDGVVWILGTAAFGLRVMKRRKERRRRTK